MSYTIDWPFSRWARLLFPSEASPPIGNIRTHRMRVETIFVVGLPGRRSLSFRVSASSAPVLSCAHYSKRLLRRLLPSWGLKFLPVSLFSYFCWTHNATLEGCYACSTIREVITQSNPGPLGGGGGWLCRMRSHPPPPPTHTHTQAPEVHFLVYQRFKTKWYYLFIKAT